MFSKKKMHVVSMVAYIIFIGIFLIVIYPLLWTISSSFKPLWQIIASPFSLPNKFFTENYVQAWTEGHFGIYFLNSVIITIPSVFGILFFSSLAAYSFARFRFKGNKAVFLFFLAGMMVSPQSIIIPSFVLMSKMRLTNTYFAPIFTFLSWGQMAVLILRAAFASLPKEIIEAAKIDGCSEFTVYWRIALPLIKPSVAAVVIFYFVWVWNNLLYSLVYLTDDNMLTIPVGLLRFQGAYSTNWGQQCAALSIAILPILIFYLLFQDKFVRGLTAGAVKA